MENQQSIRAPAPFLLLAMLLCATGTLSAEPKPSFRLTPSDPQPIYSPASTTQANSAIELTSNKYAGPLYIVFTELSRFPPSSSPETGVSYALYSRNGASRLSADGHPAGSQETLGGIFPDKSKMHDRLSLGYLVEIEPSSLPPPGTHRIAMRADLYAGAYPSSGGLADTADFSIVIQVGSFYDVSIVPSGDAYSRTSTTTAIAFGALTPNDSKGADILVKANISFDLSLSSLNGGALANGTDGTKLPYSLSANGAAVALQAGAASLIANGAPAGYGIPARYALVVTLLPFSDLPTEGAYSDLITVTLSAR